MYIRFKLLKNVALRSKRRYSDAVNASCDQQAAFIVGGHLYGRTSNFIFYRVNVI